MLGIWLLLRKQESDFGWLAFLIPAYVTNPAAAYVQYIFSFLFFFASSVVI
jgi:hypothetical protein